MDKRKIIYLDDAIETVCEEVMGVFSVSLSIGYDVAEAALEKLPSAQPEIIRCKDCKYRDKNWRRVSVKWLPCMDVQTSGNWYCGSAEREEQE